MKTLRATALRIDKRTRKLIGVCLLALLAAACGPLDAIQGTLYGAREFIVEARATGEIIPGKADLLITDAEDATRSIQELKAELDAIPSGPQKRQQQFAAVRRASVKWRAIYARGNFAGVNSAVERYGRLANAAFVAVESYYASRAGPATGMEAMSAKSEKQLKREMDQAIKDLEAAEKDLKK